MQSENKIHLNRLFFLYNKKKIEENCPFFVIEFVSKSLGIKFDYENINWKRNSKSLINTINDILNENSYIDINDMEKYLPDLALFVNPNYTETWKKSTILIEAFFNIINYTPNIPLKSEETFGYKTESNPYAIDPIMSYQIARHYKFKYNRETKLEEIQDKILKYSVQLTILRQNILEKVTSSIMSRSRRGLITFKNFISESPTAASSGLDFPEKYPKNREEAIERAAKDYRWDITLSKDPVQEYIELDSSSTDRYIPVDKNWKEVFDINRKFFHLDFRYINKFKHLYNKDTIKSIRYRNGGVLINDYLTFGVHPFNNDTIKLKDCKTSINMESIPTDTTERYVTLISSPDFIVTRDELFDLWNAKKYFVSPISPSVIFSETQIQMIKINLDHGDKLRLLITKMRKEENEIKKRIYEKNEDNIHEKSGQGLNEDPHKKSNDNTKLSLYKNFFEDILELGFIIRGYNTCYDTYPLTESIYDIEKYQDIIEEKTYYKTKEIKEKYMESAGFIEEIPVFTGRNILGSIKKDFILSLYDSTFKISDVLDRILNPDSIDGCIRTNSNYLIITSYVFMTTITKKEPFNISELRMIS